jgi:hypothetical protein
MADAVEMLLEDCLDEIQRQALPLSAFGATTSEIRTRLLELEQSTDSVVVGALQSACEGYGWPPLTPYEATMAYLRLEWAWSHWRGLTLWARFLRGAPPDPEQLPAEPYPILQFLLATAWQEQGFPAILDILAACGPTRIPPKCTDDRS